MRDPAQSFPCACNRAELRVTFNRATGDFYISVWRSEHALRRPLWWRIREALAVLWRGYGWADMACIESSEARKAIDFLEECWHGQAAICSLPKKLCGKGCHDQKGRCACRGEDDEAGI